MGNHSTPKGSSTSLVGHMVIGKILKSWGLRGQLKVEPLTDFPNRFEIGNEFFIGSTKYTCSKFQRRTGTVILQLDGLNSKEDADNLQGAFLTIPEAEAFQLPQGTYYYHEVEGLDVWTEEDSYLGKVTEIISTTSNDVYVVKTLQKEILIPATSDVIKLIDLKTHRLTITVIPGLFEN